MSNIAKLAVTLTADAAGFKSGLDGAAKHAESWQKKMGGVLSFALPALGVAGFASKLMSTIDQLEDVGDQAARSGIDVEKFMSIIGTLDSEDTSLATNALGKLRKSLSEIDSGNKEKLQSFLDVGLDASTMKLEGIDEALRRVAKAYMAAEDPLRSFAIATAAFGKAGAEIIPVLEKIAASEHKANRFAGMTKEDIETATKAHEAKTQLQNMAQAAWNFAAVDIAETLQPKLFMASKIKLKPIGFETPGLEKWEAKKKELEADRKSVSDALFGNQVKGAVDLLGKGKSTLEEWVKSAKDFAKEIKSSGLATLAETRTPLEQFQSKLADLQKQKLFGAIDGDTFDRARGQAFKALEKMADIDEAAKRKTLFDNLSQTATTLGRGTAEEGSFKAKFEQSQDAARSMPPQQDIATRIAEALKAAQETEKAQLGELKEISRHLKQVPKMGMAALGN